MAKYHGREQFLTVGTPVNSDANHNLTGYLMEATIPLDSDLGDVTTAGSVGHRFYPGLQKGSGSFKFVADGADANASWNVFSNYGLIQQAHPSNYYSANYGPGGTTSGNPNIKFNFLIKSVSLPVKVADVVEMSVSWEADNGYNVNVF